MNSAEGVRSDVPRHVAIIMDGNGRWAVARRLPRFAGHAKGVDAVRATVNACLDAGIEYLTLFAFSSENWRRPAEEVSVLMRLFIAVLEREIAQMARLGIQLRVVGDTQVFESRLQGLITQAHARPVADVRLNLTVCANYGGRWDIMQATRAMLVQRPDLAANPQQITESDWAPYLAMAFAPDPDLFIRTGGEQRISNYLLWQLAYTELYFTETFWPEFGRQQLECALASFRARERRFGRTSAQLAHASSALHERAS